MAYIKHKSEESMEDYLETILILQKRNGEVRSIDIAKELRFTKASISIAMKGLREKGLILVAENGAILLTDDGQKIAQKVFERHTFLSDWLISLGIDEDIAREDACRIEHDISEETFVALKTHFQK